MKSGKHIVRFIKSLFCKHALSGGVLFMGNPEMGYFCGKCGYFVYFKGQDDSYYKFHSINLQPYEAPAPQDAIRMLKEVVNDRRV